tara:strand:+ start:68 stop:700 length:633 start_codon:yes stop_codon:yes gene_type:complete
MATEAESRAKVSAKNKSKEALAQKLKRNNEILAKRKAAILKRDKIRITKILKDIAYLKKSEKKKPENKKIIDTLNKKIKVIKARYSNEEKAEPVKDDTKKSKERNKYDRGEGTGKGVDNAGPEGQETRRVESNKAKSLMAKKKDDNKRTSMKDFKGTNDDAGDDRGPIGGKRDDQKKKKKKKSMLGKNRVGAGKGRYGDNRKTGNYYGQR